MPPFWKRIRQGLAKGLAHVPLVGTSKLTLNLSHDVVRDEKRLQDAPVVDYTHQEEEEEHLMASCEADRSAVASVDLSGTWKPVVTAAFRDEYDRYLQHCGEGVFFRKALLAAIGLSREIYDQHDDGRVLHITGVAPVKQWKRSLVASAAAAAQDMDRAATRDDFQPILTSFRDPDGDTVQVEAWWEQQGTVHTSILRDKPRVHGGIFESKRYLDPHNGNVLICNSTFYPATSHYGSKRFFQQDSVQWRFERES